MQPERPKFKLPVSFDNSVTFSAVEQEIVSLWAAIDMLARQPKSTRPRIAGCECDVEYIGGHWPECQSKR